MSPLAALAAALTFMLAASPAAAETRAPARAQLSVTAEVVPSARVVQASDGRITKLQMSHDARPPRETVRRAACTPGEGAKSCEWRELVF